MDNHENGRNDKHATKEISWALLVSVHLHCMLEGRFEEMAVLGGW